MIPFSAPVLNPSQVVSGALKADCYFQPLASFNLPPCHK